MTATQEALISPTLGEPGGDNSATALFQEDWATYRKIVDGNYLFHREAYDALHRFLAAEAPHPFRFVDLACGDASASAVALRDTAVAHYRGVDTSAPALDLARLNIGELPCPGSLEQGDFATRLGGGELGADVIWIGLSLHHFRTAQKLELMHAARQALGAGGSFLIYENASPGNETRSAWMKRWDEQRPSWRTLTDAEWESIGAHVHACDFPETDATWHALGTAAGFGKVLRLYICPTDLFRLYCFRT